MIKKLILFVILFSSPLYAQLSPSFRAATKFDIRELQAFLKKQNRERYVIPAKFSINGEVQSSWTNTHEKLGSVEQVGTGTGRANDSYSVKTIFQCIYKSGRTWGHARVNFNDAMGLFGGSANSIALTRAYIGYHFTTYGPFTADLTIGRRELIKIYDSQMMYSSRGDGGDLYLAYQWKDVVDIEAWVGTYVSMSSLTLWISRCRFLNIANRGLFFDYSFNRWGKHRPPGSLDLISTQFNISQFLFGWQDSPKWLNNEMRFFLAIIYNHGAESNFLSNFEKESLAGYVGWQFGRLITSGDFSIQAQMQLCELQSIPDWDMSGIGRGNAARGALMTSTTLRGVNGNTNFMGWKITLNYNLSSSLTLAAKLNRSVSQNQRIGLPSNFTQFSLQTTFVY